MFSTHPRYAKACAPLLFKKETGKFSLLNGVSYKRRVIDKLRAENVRKMPVYQKNQDALWHIVGERPGGPDRIRVNVIGVLRPEPNNPHDEYAVAVVVTDHRVGHLSREDAALMQHAVIRLEHEHGRAIGLHGVIAGGGRRANGPGQLGVFLSFDPTDFGLPRSADAPAGPARRSTVRTGLSVAAATDREDLRYDLSWVDGLAGRGGPRRGRRRRPPRQEGPGGPGAVLSPPEDRAHGTRRRRHDDRRRDRLAGRLRADRR